MEHKDSALLEAIESCRKWCIPQGPLDIIIQQNPFMGMEDHNYWQVVERAALYKGMKPYLSLEEYSQHFRSGRIDGLDLERVISAEMERSQKSDSEISFGNRSYLRSFVWSKLIWVPRYDHTRASLAKCTEKKDLKTTDLITKKISQTNFELPINVDAKFSRHRDLTRSEEILVAILQGYLDQGIGSWTFPNREAGFFHSFREMIRHSDFCVPDSLKWKKSSNNRDLFNQKPIELLHDLLAEYGVNPTDYEEALICELFSLHGWISMAAKLEKEPHRASHVDIRISLVDVIAAKVWLKRNFNEPLAYSASCKNNRDLDLIIEPSFVSEVVHLTKRLGLTLDDLEKIDHNQWQVIFQEVKDFSEIKRRRLLHKAFERNYRKKMLQDLVGSAASRKQKIQAKKSPSYQMFFCLDAREESFRRHLESVEPNIKTYGVAGFFGIDMYWQSFGEVTSAPYCPVVITPKATVKEILSERSEHLALKRGKQIRRTKILSRSFYQWTRSALIGWFLQVTTGLFAFIPMFFRVLFPRWTANFKHALWQIFLPHLETELDFIRTARDQKKENSLGFTYEEMADRLEGVLKTVGLTSDFAPLLVVAGHGSTCFNNPYKSAYECGACGGRQGGHNARVFAKMANLPQVRALLAQRGVVIPNDTWFLGAYHDTASDRIDFFDLTSLPLSHRYQFERLEEILLEVRKRNAQERCKRFDGAKEFSPEKALRHVEARSQSLAEPRPEYGNASNAVCVVGRREWTMSLCLDRRSFLASYDYEADPTGEWLVNLMSAISPVVEGINLQYTFSAMDPKGIGSGTKLPHNVVGLIGVMNGGKDDLQTGFASQMVEIHEPMRLLVVIEAKKEQAEQAFQKVPHLNKVVTNEWMQLAFYDPHEKSVYQYKPGGFVLRSSETLSTRSAL